MITEKLNFFEQYKKQDIAGMFYEDIRMMKDICYQAQQLFQIKDYQKTHRSLFPFWFIYSLKKEKYFLLIRTLPEPFNKTSNRYKYGFCSFLIQFILHLFENDSDSYIPLGDRYYFYKEQEVLELQRRMQNICK